MCNFWYRVTVPEITLYPQMASVTLKKIAIYSKDLIWEKNHKIPGNEVIKNPIELIERELPSEVFDKEIESRSPLYCSLEVPKLFCKFFSHL